MIEVDWVFFAFAVPATMFAAISKAGFGSGASFASAAILALIVDPAAALGIMLPLLMLIDVASLRPYWGKWDWPEAKLLIMGGIPGVGIGIWLYQVADADVFRLLIGSVALGFVVWRLGSARGLFGTNARPLAWPFGILAGAVGGFTSFVSHAGGPPFAVYLLSRGLPKTTYQATTVLTFWVINSLKAVPYAILGVFTWQTLGLNLILAPFALLGTAMGVWAHRLVSERFFFGLTYVLLAVTGSKLIWDALT